MNHRQAVGHLADFGDPGASLEAGTERALAAHVERCAKCRDWLATRSLLAAGLSSQASRADGHPGSDLLALCAIRPAEVFEPDREDLRRHLDRCPVCRRDLERVRTAVLGARPASSGHGSSEDLGRAAPLPASVVGRVAAAVALLVACGLLAWLLLAPPPPATPGEPAAAAVEPPPAAGVDHLSGDLAGHQIVDGGVELVVSRLTVTTGADVTILAQRRVAFGDGFRVAPGARLTVVAGRSEDTGSNPADPGREPGPPSYFNRKENTP